MIIGFVCFLFICYFWRSVVVYRGKTIKSDGRKLVAGYVGGLGVG